MSTDRDPTIKARSEKRRRTKLIAVRLLPTEYLALQQESVRQGISIGKLIRNNLLAAATRPGQGATDD